MKYGITKRLGTAIRAFRFPSIADLDRIMDMAVSGSPVHSGVVVNRDTALNFSAFWCGVNLICQSIASLNLRLYKQINDNTKKFYKSHPLWNILKVNVSKYMTTFIWKETAHLHLILYGNTYSFIDRDMGGRVIGLILINPERMRPERVGGEIVYIFTKNNGEEELFRFDEIYHVPGLGFDGIKGYSILKIAAESIGLGLAYEEFAARFIGNGTHVGGILKTPNKLTPQARENLKKSFNEAYSGLGNAHKALLLEEGVEWDKTVMPLQDAEFMASRTFQVDEIARWLNIPPHKLKELTRATYDNITSEQISWLQDTIRPWLERDEAIMNFKLLNDWERRNLFCEYDFESILRSDPKTRSEAHHIMRQDGIISTDEWRAKENLNPVGGEYGDERLVPMNMIPASKLYDSNTPIQKVGDQQKNLENKSSLSKRQAESISERKKLARVYEPIFAENIRGIIKKERKDVSKIIKKYFKERAGFDFKLELKNYYNDFLKTFNEAWGPIFKTFSRAIAKVSIKEIERDIMPAGFDQEVDKYIDNTGKRYISSSQGQIIKLVNENPDDEINAIENRMDDWYNTRPDRIGHRESVDGETGIAQIVFFANGFRSMWVTIGSSCPYCQRMDGKIISRGGTFLNAGEKLTAEGLPDFPVTYNISHPSAHSGCDCTVMATI